MMIFLDKAFCIENSFMYAQTRLEAPRLYPYDPSKMLLIHSYEGCSITNI